MIFEPYFLEICGDIGKRFRGNIFFKVQGTWGHIGKRFLGNIFFEVRGDAGKQILSNIFFEVCGTWDCDFRVIFSSRYGGHRGKRF